jgi:hypothetical protein
MPSSEEKAVIADEKEAERAEAKRQKEIQKHSFSVSLAGTKESASSQISQQVHDSSIGSALKAIIAAAPGNSVSIAGTMETSEDFSKGTITLTGNFETIPEEVQKAHDAAQASADRERRTAKKK